VIGVRVRPGMELCSLTPPRASPTRPVTTAATLTSSRSPVRASNTPPVARSAGEPTGRSAGPPRVGIAKAPTASPGPAWSAISSGARHLWAAASKTPRASERDGAGAAHGLIPSSPWTT